MAEAEKRELNYKYLLKEFTEDVIRERGSYWYQLTEGFIKSLSLNEHLYISKNLLRHLLINYFADIQRLKEFHSIERAHKIKIFAYGIFWYLRLSPVQLKSEFPDSQIFVNEKLAATILIAEFLPSSCKSEIRYRYLEDLVYFFKYRHYTAQTIENHITALLVGAGKDPFICKLSS